MCFLWSWSCYYMYFRYIFYLHGVIIVKFSCFLLLCCYRNISYDIFDNYLFTSHFRNYYTLFAIFCVLGSSLCLPNFVEYLFVFRNDTLLLYVWCIHVYRLWFLYWLFTTNLVNILLLLFISFVLFPIFLPRYLKFRFTATNYFRLTTTCSISDI